MAAQVNRTIRSSTLAAKNACGEFRAKTRCVHFCCFSLWIFCPYEYYFMVCSFEKYVVSTLPVGHRHFMALAAEGKVSGTPMAFYLLLNFTFVLLANAWWLYHCCCCMRFIMLAICWHCCNRSHDLSLFNCECTGNSSYLFTHHRT
jgi:hypothetical protein